MILLLSGCTQTDELRTVDLPANTHTAELIPDVEDYSKDTEIMTSAVAPIAGTFTTAVSSYATSNPQLGQAAGDYVTSFGRCADTKGLAKITYYHSDEDILDHALLFIVNEDKEKAVQCLIESFLCQGCMSIVDTSKEYGVFTIKYSFKTPSNQIFHVGAVTTTKEIAEDLCEKLAGCQNSDIHQQYKPQN